MPRSNPRAPSAFAALSLSAQPLGDGAQLLIPDGEFRSSDGSGRPEGVPAWRLNAQLAAQVIAARRERGVKIVVDYEHATLTRAKEGLPAPAAGWIDPAHLEYRPGVGLVARQVEWTTTAAGHLAAREYGYGSPVFPFDPTTGDVTGLHSFALTNDPGLTGVNTALSALTAAHPQETPEVNETLKKLLAALGLAEDASEADITAAVDGLKKKADAAAQPGGAAATLEAFAPDPAKFVPVEAMQALQSEVATLSARINGDEAGRLIEQAIGQGKLIEAQRGWATDLGKKDIAALRAYVASAPAIAALAGMQTTGADPAALAAPQQSAADLAVCKALGLTAEQFAAGKLER